MAEQSSGLGEAVDVGTHAASHLHAMKTAAHLSKTVAGAAAGNAAGRGGKLMKSAGGKAMSVAGKLFKKK